MQKFIRTICIFFILPNVLLSGCFNFDPLNLLSEVTVINRSASSVEVRSQIVDSTGGITQLGHVWSEFSNPEVYRLGSFQTEFTPGANTVELVSIITNLEPNKIYFVRAYIIINNDRNKPIYGRQVSFSTNGNINKPDEIINILGTANIKSNSATVGAKIEKLSPGSQVLNYGHCWSTSPKPEIDDFKTEFSNPIGIENYNSNLTGLSPNTKYYVRAYMITSQSNNQVIYSSGELDFITTNN